MHYNLCSDVKNTLVILVESHQNPLHIRDE